MVLEQLAKELMDLASVSSMVQKLMLKMEGIETELKEIKEELKKKNNDGVEKRITFLESSMSDFTSKVSSTIDSLVSAPKECCTQPKPTIEKRTEAVAEPTKPSVVIDFVAKPAVQPVAQPVPATLPKPVAGVESEGPRKIGFVDENEPIDPARVEMIKKMSRKDLVKFICDNKIPINWLPFSAADLREAVFAWMAGKPIPERYQPKKKADAKAAVIDKPVQTMPKEEPKAVAPEVITPAVVAQPVTPVDPIMEERKNILRLGKANDLREFLIANAAEPEVITHWNKMLCHKDCTKCDENRLNACYLSFETKEEVSYAEVS